MALTKISTDGFKDDAVTTDKLANDINTERTANTAKDLTALSASNLTSGTVPDARFPATLPAKSAANLTNIPAANITGTLPAISGANLTDLPASGKATNLIINGAMQVNQRYTSYNNVGNNEYTIDRFQLIHPYSTNFNVSHSTEAPDGFSNSYKLDINTADTSIGAGQYVGIRHKIEAQNLQQLAYGTSSAKSITLSFYVRSNVTGTYAINLQQKDNSAKQVNGTYTISSADTWERKSFTFAGDTAGVINNDNGNGMAIIWWLAAGSDRTSGSVRSTWTAHTEADEAVGHAVNIMHSTSNNFHLTGVQLEVSDSVSDFAHDSSYDETLRKCQRYYQVLVNEESKYFGGGYMYDHYRAYLPVQYYVEMRTAPGFEFSSGTNYWSLHRNGSGDNFDGWNTAIGGDNKHTAIQAQSGLSGTGGHAGAFWSNTANSRIAFTAEL